ncbi:MAG: hypothetical protein DMF61_22730 [Blastocatellia bacterium AA13]|nr:MAG: hypothetical protein DMF61_22730 [Blastocatellia bacterium AA13]
MSLETLISTWKDVRSGLIEEAELIPAESFGFRATPEMRSVAEILQHVMGVQQLLSGELCRPDTNLARAPFLDLVKEYAPEVLAAAGKEELVSLLSSTMDKTEARIRSFGEEGLAAMTRRFDGKEISKHDFLMFSISHEMYHRGQLTVFERLLNLEPALTTRLKKMFGSAV